MPAITATDMGGSGAKSITETTLNGSDTFVYDGNRDPILYLRNPTAGAISATIDGSGASTTHGIEGVGTMDLSGGYAVGSIAAGAAKAIRLSTIRHYLEGTIAINSGTGLVASLLNF